MGHTAGGRAVVVAVALGLTVVLLVGRAPEALGDRLPLPLELTEAQREGLLLLLPQCEAVAEPLLLREGEPELLPEPQGEALLLPLLDSEAVEQLEPLLLLLREGEPVEQAEALLLLLRVGEPEEQAEPLLLPEALPLREELGLPLMVALREGELERDRLPLELVELRAEVEGSAVQMVQVADTLALRVAEGEAAERDTLTERLMEALPVLLLLAV
jgi:hypothetical protein